MKRLRIYADTSVFGGCFDDEFADESRILFKEINKGKFILVISLTTFRELTMAPDNVKQILADLPPKNVEIMEYSGEIGILRDAYINAGILEKSSKADAEHVASASVADVDFVVSWNFRHIVHYDKISGFQAVNLINGYKPIRIYSPKEIIDL